MKIRKALVRELDIAFDLLKESAQWLKDKNIDYWQNWHNPTDLYRNWIKQGFEKKQFYFIESDESVIGMYRLQYEDEMFWGKKNDKSAYIHSFTTKRSLSGKGLGREILKMIEQYLLKQDIHILRLDCGANITGLCKYYENCSFICVGQTEIHGEILNLYEKRLPFSMA